MVSRSACQLSYVPSLRRPTSCVLRRVAAKEGRRQLSNATEIVQELKNRRLPIRIDDPVPGPAERLRVALADFLSANIRPRLDQPVLGFPPKWLQPGHHLVYFPPVTSESELLEDGTDILHAPDKSWKYRLWAGGSLECIGVPRLGAFLPPLALVERIGDVKVRDSKVFVQIQRAVVGTERAARHDMDEDVEQRLRALAFPETSDHQNPPDRPYVPFLRETRWLCFMKEKPPTPTSPPKLNPPSNHPAFSITMTPTPSLLFRFSALTFNAHAIHIDAEYTKSVYGLPERLVQGPLTLVLMIEVARRAVYNTTRRTGEKKYTVTNIHYKNHAPLYVNEEMTIACGELETPSPSGDDDDNNNAHAKKTMSVWIQKMQHGQPTVCVSGTVTFTDRERGNIGKRPRRRAWTDSSQSGDTGEDNP